MKYSKQQIGEFLKKDLDKSYDVKRISGWAHNIFFYHGTDFEPDLGEVLECLALMGAGPEFEYSEFELRSLAGMLMNNEKDPLKKIADIQSK